MAGAVKERGRGRGSVAGAVKERGRGRGSLAGGVKERGRGRGSLAGAVKVRLNWVTDSVQTWPSLMSNEALNPLLVLHERTFSPHALCSIYSMSWFSITCRMGQVHTLRRDGI